jgi:hypothetical protein
MCALLSMHNNAMGSVMQEKNAVGTHLPSDDNKI